MFEKVFWETWWNSYNLKGKNPIKIQCSTIWIIHFQKLIVMMRVTDSKHGLLNWRLGWCSVKTTRHHWLRLWCSVKTTRHHWLRLWCSVKTTRHHWLRLWWLFLRNHMVLFLCFSRLEGTLLLESEPFQVYSFAHLSKRKTSRFYCHIF